MEILEIIPFYKTFKKNTLSYFSNKPVPIGSIVTINIRNRDVKGIVISKKEAEEQKQEVRSKEFVLKKISSVNQNTILNSEIIKASEDIADYFATSTGAIISSIIPKFVLDNLDKIKKIKREELKNGTSNKVPEKYVIQESEEERYSSYKRLIREEFAKKNSVLFICPTKEDVRFAYNQMSKGISDNTYTFTSDLSNKKLLEEWNNSLSEEKPVLIICTPTYISIPRKDIGSIVVERENSRSYKSMRTPYFDFRMFAEAYAKHKGIRFFLGDLVLRLETITRLEGQEFHEFTPAIYRTLTTATTKIIDMSENTIGDGGKFKLFSNEMKKMIEDSHEENERTFLLVSRRGLSPNIVCMDCGQIVECNNCNSPMVLHGKEPTEEKNFFLCHKCGDKRSAGETCKKCGGWRLKTLGIGSQTVKDEIETLFPEIETMVIDSDHAKTAKQAQNVIDKFNESPGTILIGTEMALLYLREDVDNVGIVSIDSMFSNPDFNINERIVNIISHTKSKASKKFILQTRKHDDPIFKYIKSGNLAEFMRNELDERKNFNYPPHSILIKIIISGTPKGVEREIEKLKDFLKEFEFSEYPIPREKKKEKISKGILLRFKRTEWPNQNLVEKLRLLPVYYKIVVNTENIF